jgi:hypothetical protein
MGAATKGRSTGKTGTAKTSSEKAGPGTSRGAPRTATPDSAEAEGAEQHEANGVPTTADGDITATATSSQQAAEQRIQAAEAPDAAPAVIGGDAPPKQADEAKAMSLPEVPVTPATAPGLEQLEMERSRLRAHLVGQQARLENAVGTGTAEQGKAQRRTFTRLQATKQAEPENVIEHEEVAVPVGDREFVARQTFGGFVEILWHRPNDVNAMRGGGPFDTIAVLSPEQWAALTSLSSAGGSAPQGQSAAEQRAGVATEGGDPGPAAPLPVVPR